METNTQKIYLTIRETARTGILPEHCLRLMQKQGKLPCVMFGNKCMVNYPMLLKHLETESKNAMQGNKETTPGIRPVMSL